MASSYFTTSLMPSGNRLITDSFCPGIESPTTASMRPDPMVQIQSLQEGLGLDILSSSGDSLQWVVGTPAMSETEDTEDDERQFWLVMETGAQMAVTYNSNSDNQDDAKQFTEWAATDSVERPLVIIPTSDSSLNDTTIFMPLEPPLMTSRLSDAVPTPNGGLLLVEAVADGTYQLTQLNADMEDVTHESLRSDVQRPLPDTHWAYSSTSTPPKWALYSDATSRYGHAVIGDALEGNTLTVLEWNDDTEQVEFHSQTELLDSSNNNSNEDTVFEGLGPMWGDVDGDGHDDLITTISNSTVGARLRVYHVIDLISTEESSSGNTVLEMLAQAPAIGLGGRWLHQLAVGPLGPNGEQEIVEIRTPHIGGIVQYYQYKAPEPESQQPGSLQLVASTTPFTSHDIRSRNLDRTLVGDLNGDGIPELVVQNQKKDTLVGLQRTENAVNGVEMVWSVPLPSPLESNIGVSCSGSGIRELLFGTRARELVRLQFFPVVIGTGEEDGNSTPNGNEARADGESVDSGSPTSGAVGGLEFLFMPGSHSQHQGRFYSFVLMLAMFWRKASHHF